MKKIVSMLTVSALAVLVGTGCAAPTDEPPLAEEDGADENTGSVAQAFNSDFCATGTTANDTENITVAGQRATYARGAGWMNGNSLCSEPRVVTIVDFNVNATHNEYEYDFFSDPDWGTIPWQDCADTKLFTRIQIKDKVTGEWVTIHDPGNGEAGVVKGLPFNPRCEPPSYAGHFRNLISSQYGDVMTRTFRVRSYGTKKSGYHPLIYIQGHNLGDY